METLARLLEMVEGPNDEARNTAYYELLDRKADSNELYAQWPRFVALLSNPNYHIRSIGGQLYCQFALSDPEGRVWELWEAWKAVAADKMFVTARHTVQASPRFALAGERHRSELLAYYQQRFASSVAEKNTTLIRHDLQGCLRAVYDQRPDPEVAALARRLIATEPDPKYQAKYKTVWRKVPE